MANSKSLLVVLGLQNRDYLKGLAESKQELRALTADVKKQQAALKDFAKTVAVAGGAVVAGFGLAIRETAKLGSELKDMSGRTGFSVEALSKLKYAAEQSGASLDDVETAVKKLANVMQDAGNGSKTAVDAFRNIGLTLADLRGLKPEDQFQKVAEAIAAIPDPMQKSAAAMDLFGKSGTSLLPMLSQGSSGVAALTRRAQELGVVMSTDTANAAEEFGDALDSLKATVQGVVVNVAGPLMTSLKPLVETISQMAGAFSNWAKANPQMAQSVSTIALAFAGIASAAGGVLLMLPKLMKGYRDLMDLMKLVGDNAVLMNTEILGLAGVAILLGEGINQLTGNAQRNGSTLDNLGKTIEFWKQKLGLARDETTGAAADTGRLMSELRGLGLTGTELQQTFDALAGKYLTIGKMTLEDVRAQVKLQQGFQNTGTAVKLAGAEAEQALAEGLSRLKSLLSAYKSQVTDTYNAAVKGINNERKAAQDAYNERIRQIDDQLSKELAAISLKYGIQSEALQQQINQIQNTLDAEEEAERRAQAERARTELQAQIGALKARVDLSDEEKSQLAQLEGEYATLIRNQQREDYRRSLADQQDNLRRQLQAIQRHAEQETEQARKKADAEKTQAEHNTNVILSEIQKREDALTSTYETEMSQIDDAEQTYAKAETDKTLALVQENNTRLQSIKEYVEAVNSLPVAVVKTVYGSGTGTMPGPNLPRTGTLPPGQRPDFTGGTVTPNPGTIGFSPIPELARGAIVPRPTLAMIGEAGPEAVVPLSKGLGGLTVVNNFTDLAVLNSEESLRKLADMIYTRIKRTDRLNYGTA